jgi:hypothetical protein
LKWKCPMPAGDRTPMEIASDRLPRHHPSSGTEADFAAARFDSWPRLSSSKQHDPEVSGHSFRHPAMGLGMRAIPVKYEPSRVKRSSKQGR